MPPFMTAFWILKNAKAMPKITVQITTAPIACATELTAAARRRRGCRSTPCGRRWHLVGAVPAGAVLAVGEDPDASTPKVPHTPCTETAPTGSSMPRFSMKPDRDDDEDAGDDADDRRGPRLHERARRRDRHQAGEHAVRHHPGIGLARPRHA